MTQVNWARLALSGLIAFVIVYFADALVHENLLDTDWKAVYAQLGVAEPQEHGWAIAYFAVFDLGRAFLSIYIYVLMRPFYGAGPKTAVLAGVVAWLAFSVTGPAQFIPLGFYSNALWIKVAVFQLITSIVSVLAGAWFYKDSAPTASS